jgi:hypothetical protein
LNAGIRDEDIKTSEGRDQLSKKNPSPAFHQKDRLAAGCSDRQLDGSDDRMYRLLPLRQSDS